MGIIKVGTCIKGNEILTELYKIIKYGIETVERYFGENIPSTGTVY